MATDTKHTNAVKLLLTDGELLDLSRLANADNRSASEMVRVILRRYMYGRVGQAPLERQRICGAHEEPRGTGWPDTEGHS